MLVEIHIDMITDIISKLLIIFKINTAYIFYFLVTKNSKLMETCQLISYKTAFVLGFSFFKMSLYEFKASSFCGKLS